LKTETLHNLHHINIKGKIQVRAFILKIYSTEHIQCNIFPYI
jgi:hypothetical protein